MPHLKKNFLKLYDCLIQLLYELIKKALNGIRFLNKEAV